MIGKNVAHMGVLAVELIALWIGVSLLFPPANSNRSADYAEWPAVRGAHESGGRKSAVTVLSEENRVRNLRTPARVANHRAGELRDPGLVFGIAAMTLLTARPTVANGWRLSSSSFSPGWIQHLFFRADTRRPLWQRRRREVLTTELCK